MLTIGHAQRKRRRLELGRTELEAVTRLPKRWSRLRPHATQLAFWCCDRRFTVVPSGRRSGKTEIAKRKLVMAALTFVGYHDGRFVACAPTHAQAKRIFWEDLKLLTPAWAVAKVSESELTIWLLTGTAIQVAGMDKPERIEGAPIDGIVLDEFANMRADAWVKHVRPALSTPDRPGWAIFIGVPEGRNHYYNLFRAAEADETGDWAAFRWKSAEIDRAEAEAARADLDRLTYLQEYEAEFISFEGRAYYAFDASRHASGRVYYDDERPLILCFDFNRKPGVCAIVQEQPAPRWLEKPGAGDITCVVGEVFISRNSHTGRVCDEILARWGDHADDVVLHGDATGGARKSAGLHGSDWDIVKAKLKPVFGHRLKAKYKRANPPVRSRMNALNSRLEAANGEARMAIDGVRCPNVVRDLEGVAATDDGDVDKPSGTELTHISDGLGYYVERRYPCKAGVASRVQPL